MARKEITAVRFHPKHLEVMRVRQQDSGLFGDFKTEESYHRVEQMANISLQALTFSYDGRILMVAGFCQLWTGVYDVWMIPSEYVYTAPVSFARLLKRYVIRVQEDLKAHRLQTVSFNDDFHERWMNFLGFQKEGVLRRFTMNEWDMCTYSRIR